MGGAGEWCCSEREQLLLNRHSAKKILVQISDPIAYIQIRSPTVPWEALNWTVWFRIYCRMPVANNHHPTTWRERRLCLWRLIGRFVPQQLLRRIMNQDHEWLRIGSTNRTNLYKDAAFHESLLPPRYCLLGNAHLESKAFNRAISCWSSAAGIFHRVSVWQNNSSASSFFSNSEANS